MHPRSAIIFLWCGWALSWLVASAWSARTEKRVGLRSEVSYRVVLLLGAMLLAVPVHGYEGILRLWRVNWLGPRFHHRARPRGSDLFARSPQRCRAELVSTLRMKSSTCDDHRLG